ncbi:hypothetical protein [Uliginosibacterium sp. 31-12]|uniref:hypothetical protein n=1 Tax=Uliginosibacterium sp. 31-12 TaxID=3062781 RepID=UPI0026E1B645|nr:hypothetical protein [Uliginosibacterium sp. 31-12]MDO6388321.1 hypothetical protein [Uliginosibacterium sp. 31-12]
MNAPKALTTFMLVFLATACTAAPSLSAANSVTIYPAKECSIGVSTIGAAIAKKLDDQRIELTWKAGQLSLKTELRFTCSTAQLDQALSEAGFEQSKGKWMLSANGQNNKALAVKTTTWSGFSGTYFQGNVCRAVVGESANKSVTFTIDYCISEQEYSKASRQFELLERSVVLKPIQN